MSKTNKNEKENNFSFYILVSVEQKRKKLQRELMEKIDFCFVSVIVQILTSSLNSTTRNKLMKIKQRVDSKTSRGNIKKK